MNFVLYALVYIFARPWPVVLGVTGILGWSPASLRPVTFSSSATLSYAFPRGTLMVWKPAFLPALRFSPMSSKKRTSSGLTPAPHAAALPRSVFELDLAYSSTIFRARL